LNKHNKQKWILQEELLKADFHLGGIPFFHYQKDTERTLTQARLRDILLEQAKDLNGASENEGRNAVLNLAGPVLSMIEGAGYMYFRARRQNRR
jgi:hypothetical protein